MTIVSNDLRATPGARDWEKSARRDCTRHHTLVAVGADLSKVADRIYGLDPGTISTFATVSGQQHENRLHADDAKLLREAAVRAGRLTAADTGYADLQALVHNNPRNMAAVKAERARLTAGLIEDWMTGRGAPAVVSHPTFPFPRSDGTDGYIESDDMLLPADVGKLFNLEVKSFPNLDGFTDTAAMRSLQRQGAVEVFSMRRALESVRAGAGIMVDEAVDIVLRGGRLHRDLNVAGPLRQIERVVPRLGASRTGPAVTAAATHAGQAVPEVTEAFVDALPARYDEGCRSYCPLSNKCRREADGGGQLVVLGRPAAREFAAVDSLDALDGLVDGTTAPATLDETEIVERYGAAVVELRRIGHASHRVVA